METFLIVVATLIGFLVMVILVLTQLTPWMDRWGAIPEEVAATFPGDDLVPNPASFVNRAVTIHARPQDIHPWIVQLGADKGGFYSFTWIEKLLGIPMVNADRIHPEWQELHIGDQVKMSTKPVAPPPYIVALVEPPQAVVMGHQEKERWVDLWQFVILPQNDPGTTRLVLRTRTMMTGGLWNIIHPGVFLMETGMLRGIRVRAEALAGAK